MKLNNQTRLLRLLGHLVDNLYEHADGNTGEGCWELYDYYNALYQEALEYDDNDVFFRKMGYNGGYDVPGFNRKTPGLEE